MELFRPSLKNKKKIHPKKISYTLLLIFFGIFSKESCCYVSGNGKPKKVYYIFFKESFSYISGNGSPEKVLGNGTFLYFRPGSETLKNFLYFRK